MPSEPLFDAPHRHEWIVSADTGQVCCLTCPAVVVDFLDVAIGDNDDE